MENKQVDFDLIIQNGFVIDGSGRSGRLTDGCRAR